MNPLKIILISNIYDEYKNPIVRDLLPKLIQLKIEGYQQEYPYGILPFDSSDFIATHILFCLEGVNGVEVVCAVKCVTLQTCDLHRIKFPLINIFQGSKSELHDKTVEEAVGKSRSTDDTEHISYFGSYTIDPKLRKNRELLSYVWDATLLALGRIHLEMGVKDAYCIASTKFQVNNKLISVGWMPETYNGEVLPNFKCHTLFDGEYSLLRGPEHTPYYHELYEKNRHLWDDKILIGKLPNQGKEILKKKSA